MNNKAKFEDRLAVIRVRKNYAAPFLKYRFFAVKRSDIKTARTFQKAIEHAAGSWPLGTYYLKLSTGQVFARFDIRDGKIIKFYKTSPITGQKYPCWEFFRAQ